MATLPPAGTRRFDFAATVSTTKASAKIVAHVRRVAELKTALPLRARGETKLVSDLKHERKNERLWVLREKKIGIVRKPPSVSRSL
jgi:hypothetical protein